MKGDFQKFKDLLERKNLQFGPLTFEQKVTIIMQSLEGQHLLSNAEGRRIVHQIEQLEKEDAQLRNRRGSLHTE